ncbi:MAG: sulfotransferase domain-containing protein [Actinomycetota bacterium]|nr:sulfotransferase domain-containing protein [Actinomycetota bacterium]
MTGTRDSSRIADGHAAIGEATPSYTRFEEAPANIARLIPDVRLIYLVRDPIDRMMSHYRYARLIRQEDRPFEEAVTTSPRYLEYFDRAQLLVLLSEDLKSQRVVTLRRVLGFLGIDPDWTSERLDREFHRAEDTYRHNLLYAGLRRVPGFGALERAAPRTVGAIARTRRRHGADYAATLSEDVRSRLERELEDEVRSLRAYLPPGFDGWGIA